MNFTEPMIFIREDIKSLWRDEEITIKQGWRSHREISRQLGYNTRMIDLSEENYLCLGSGICKRSFNLSLHGKTFVD